MEHELGRIGSSADSEEEMDIHPRRRAFLIEHLNGETAKGFMGLSVGNPSMLSRICNGMGSVGEVEKSLCKNLNKPVKAAMNDIKFTQEGGVMMSNEGEPLIKPAKKDNVLLAFKRGYSEVALSLLNEAQDDLHSDIIDALKGNEAFQGLRNSRHDNKTIAEQIVGGYARLGVAHAAVEVVTSAIKLKTPKTEKGEAQKNLKIQRAGYVEMLIPKTLEGLLAIEPKPSIGQRIARFFSQLRLSRIRFPRMNLSVFRNLFKRAHVEPELAGSKASGEDDVLSAGAVNAVSSHDGAKEACPREQGIHRAVIGGADFDEPGEDLDALDDDPDKSPQPPNPPDPQPPSI